MKPLRIFALVLAGGALATLGWILLTLVWREPATWAYTAYQQHGLGGELARTEYASPAEFRRSVRPGMPIGRLRIPRLDLDVIVVEGTDTAALRRGPGRDPRAGFPGERGLVYIAGHRTTYGAPFAHIDRLGHGDLITLELPYATFTYRVTGHRIVDDTDTSVLRDEGQELLRLQACHPRFSAEQRYVVSATFVGTTASTR